ncbi:hypothetical protein ABW21_db0200442 [Orbilia brochopaga]|nr:hypothetical protein ABW21_db0200442 [Drechslerella brochopaga]
MASSMWKKMIGKKDRDRTSKDLGYQFPQGDHDAVYENTDRSPPLHGDVSDSISSSPSAAVIEYDRTPPRQSSGNGFRKPFGKSKPDKDYEGIQSSASAPVVDYDRQTPDAFSSSDTASSALVVDYTRTPPKASPPGYGAYPPPSAAAVQRGRPIGTLAPAMYRADPPPQQQPMQQQPMQQQPMANSWGRNPTTAPVQYAANPPPVSPEVVDYIRSQPGPPPGFMNSDNGPPVSPPMVDYGYAQGPPASINALLHQPPLQPPSPELPAYSSPEPPRPSQPRYPGANENSSNKRPNFNAQEHEWVPPPQPIRRDPYTTPRNENSAYASTDNSSASSLYDAPYTGGSTSTAPTSYYSPSRSDFPTPTVQQYPAYGQPPGAPKIGAGMDDDGEDPNVSKFAARIFCQRKRAEGDTREEFPRDIREFRLANLALIKLAAGRERHVLLDAVFGELDKQVAPLLEKHWYVTPQTRVQDCSISGSSLATKIGPIMVAYKGDSSVLYVEFGSPDECMCPPSHIYKVCLLAKIIILMREDD